MYNIFLTFKKGLAMLEIQRKYIDFVSFVKEKTQDIAAVDKNKQDELIKAIEGKRLIVPVVGGFSAGKSSLINQFLGKDILSTSITPETAMATELIYADSSYYEAVRSDGSSVRFELSQTESIKNQAADFEFLRLYLNEPKLKQIEPLILVDMPGFEAPLADHNKAILSYLAKGVYFIIVISVEDGIIKKSIIREIQNIMTVGKGFTFCLSKTNLRGDAELQSVKEAIEAQLQDEFDYQKELVLTSKNSAQEFQNILAGIKPEALFEKIYKDDLKNYYFQTESSINTQISVLKSSKEDIAKILENLSLGVQEVKNARDGVLAKAESKYAGKNIDSIINAVEGALLAQKASLIGCMQLPNVFNSEINSIVRNIVIPQITDEARDLHQDIMQGFNHALSKVNANLRDTGFSMGFGEILDSALSSAKHNKPSEVLANLPIGFVKTTVVLTGKILSPLLQYLNQFLLKKELEKKFESEVVPSIKAKLKTDLPLIFNQYISQATDAIALKFEEQIKQKEEEIAKSAKEQESKASDIEQEIANLQNIKAQIAELSNKTF
ncbi:hypothetical protein BKN38_09695 [Helicobacter sp. CLO-3]|nr:hypothetical protein BA723_09215 [Helicobacter sp. CLO-3]OHU81105.1 hypothetical protein BKN38_09695 [Helicobacter sp. CLO-3]